MPAAAASRIISPVEEEGRRSRTQSTTAADAKGSDGGSGQDQEVDGQLFKHYEFWDVLCKSQNISRPEFEDRLTSALESSELCESVQEELAMCERGEMAASHGFMADLDRWNTAAVLLRSAKYHKPVKGVRWDSHRAGRAFEWHVASSTTTFYNLAAIALCLLMFAEPLTSWTGTTAVEVVVAELVLSLILATDLFTQMFYMHARDFLPWNYVWMEQYSFLKVSHFMFVVLSLSDVIFGRLLSSEMHVFRWSRPVRPLYFLFINPGNRAVLKSFITALKALSDLAVMTVVFIMGFAVVGISMFGDSSSARSSEGVYKNSFTTIGTACLTLFSLLTFDNFPDVLRDLDLDITTDAGIAAGIFFVCFMILAFAILSLTVAVVYECYKANRSSLEMQLMLREWEFLHAGFLLISQGAREIGVHQVLSALAMAFPKDMGQFDEQAFLRDFHLAPNGQVTKFEFCGFVSQKLLGQYQLNKPNQMPKPYKRFPKIRMLVTSRPFERMVMASIFVYITGLMLRSSDAGQGVRTEVFEGIDTMFLCIFTAEMGLKLLGLGRSKYWSANSNRFDGGLVLMSWFGAAAVALWDTTAQLSSSNVTIARAPRVLRLLRAARTLTIVSHDKRLRALSHTLIRSIHTLGEMTVLVVVFFYFYSVIGLEIFHEKVRWADDAHCHPWCAGFHTVASSMLSLVQVAFVSNWTELMYFHMSFTSFYANLFFTTFCIAISLCLVTLLSALLLDIYNTEVLAAQAHQEERKQFMNQLFAGKQGFYSTANVNVFVTAFESRPNNHKLSNGVLHLFMQFSHGVSPKAEHERLRALEEFRGVEKPGEKSKKKPGTPEKPLIARRVSASWGRFRKGSAPLAPDKAKSNKLDWRVDTDNLMMDYAGFRRFIMQGLSVKMSSVAISRVIDEISDPSGHIDFCGFTEWWTVFGIGMLFHKYEMKDFKGYALLHDLPAMLAMTGVKLSPGEALRVKAGVLQSQLQRKNARVAAMQEYRTGSMQSISSILAHREEAARASPQQQVAATSSSVGRTSSQPDMSAVKRTPVSALSAVADGAAPHAPATVPQQSRDLMVDGVATKTAQPTTVSAPPVSPSASVGTYRQRQSALSSIKRKEKQGSLKVSADEPWGGQTVFSLLEFRELWGLLDAYRVFMENSQTADLRGSFACLAPKNSTTKHEQGDKVRHRYMTSEQLTQAAEQFGYKLTAEEGAVASKLLNTKDGVIEFHEFASWWQRLRDLIVERRTKSATAVHMHNVEKIAESIDFLAKPDEKKPLSKSASMRLTKKKAKAADSKAESASSFVARDSDSDVAFNSSTGSTSTRGTSSSGIPAAAAAAAAVPPAAAAAATAATAAAAAPPAAESRSKEEGQDAR
jgi:hypothetical protein